jgi:uncharacterized protein with ParB-like and HNH nuclease domain
MEPKLTKNAEDIFYEIPTFKVPSYQRTYSWSKDQFEELISDIESIKTRPLQDNTYQILKGHFLGLIVLVQNTDKDGIKHFYVVDGQQRIETIIILSAAARDAIKETLKTEKLTEEEKNTLEQIQDAFVRTFIFYVPRPLGNKTVRLLPSKSDIEMFNKIIVNEGSLSSKETILIEVTGKRKTNKNQIFQSYKFFYLYIQGKLKNEGIQSMNELYYKIGKGITFVNFLAENESDAFNVFETLNDRGLDLSAQDLIKNKILQISAKFGQERLEKNEEQWNNIFSKDGVIQFEKTLDFFRYNWLSKHGLITKNELYDKYKEEIELNENEIDNFLSDLQHNAEYYRDITEVFKVENEQIIFFILDQDIREFFFLLNKTRVKLWISLGMASYRLYKSKAISKEELIEIQKLLFSICIRFKVIDKRTSLIEKELPELSKCLFKKETYSIDKDKNTKNFKAVSDIKEVLSFILDKLKEIIITNVSDNDLKSVLNSDYAFEDNELAYVVLRRIANDKIKHGIMFDQTKDLTLEHILPIKHKRYWNNWKDAEEIKYLIGNMILLNSPENSSIKHKGLVSKIDFYKTINVIDCVDSLDLYYDKDPSWSLGFIQNRSNEIITNFLKLV